MSKYELYKKEVGIMEDVIFILPTIRVVIDSPMFLRKKLYNIASLFEFSRKFYVFKEG